MKLPKSTDPKTMSENIDKLNGQIEQVDTRTLPATTSATAGQILGLVGNNKTPTWINDPSPNWDYSETEVNTGQKWIDGKDIYSISFIIEGDETQTSITKNIDLSELNIGDLLFYNGFCKQIVTGGVYFYPLSFYASSANRSLVQFYNTTKIFSHTMYYASGNYGGAVIVIYYTKSDTPAAQTSPAPGETRGVLENELTEEAEYRESVEAATPEEPELTETKTTRSRKTTK